MARRKGERGSAGLGEGVRPKHPNRPAKKPAKSKVAMRGRPPPAGASPPWSRPQQAACARRHPGRSSHPRARAAWNGPVQSGRWQCAGENRGEILCLPNPEWLPHLLTVTGPSEPLTAFRKAAAGPGTIAWQRDYARLEEDWVYTLLAPPPAERGISVHGARIVASQMRELIETLEIRAADRATDKNCPLDLNALVPMPDLSAQARTGGSGRARLAVGELGHDLDAARCRAGAGRPRGGYGTPGS